MTAGFIAFGGNMEISDRQFTDLLMGLIRAQAASLSAIATTDDVATKIVPALQASGGITPREPLSLSTWPSRALLSAMTGSRIDPRDLQGLLERPSL
jgi:hypothetical protein